MREETFARGPRPGGHPCRIAPARGPAINRVVSEQRHFDKYIFFFSENNAQDACFAVRLLALLNRVRLRGIFFRR